MTYSGNIIEDEFDPGPSLEDDFRHTPFTLKQLSDLGMQLVSQLEILHKLGYTHGDIKFKNICFDKISGNYSLIDFGLAKRIFHRNGMHMAQK